MILFENNRRGQSLTEVLVATAVTAILIIAAIALLSPVLRNDRSVGTLRIGGAFTRDLADKTRIFAEADWHNIYNLATSSANRYYLTTSTSPFSVVSGSEPLSVSSTTYSRYFYVDEVRRDTTTKQITTSTNNSIVDPSTRQITVVVTNTQGASSSITQIVTRYENSVTYQSDWSGGEGYTGPSSGTTNQFFSGSNINASSVPGSIILNTL